VVADKKRVALTATPLTFLAISSNAHFGENRFIKGHKPLSGAYAISLLAKGRLICASLER